MGDTGKWVEPNQSPQVHYASSCGKRKKGDLMIALSHCCCAEV
jgi:hypothetical protein